MAKVITFFDVTDDDRRSIQDHFDSQKDVELSYHTEPLGSDNVELAKQADIISVYITSEINAEIIKKLPKLKLIAVRATGYDNIDLSAAKKAEVLVANVPGYGETTVAEYTFGLMLALMRKLLIAIDQVKSGRIDHAQLTGLDLAGKTLGVVGTGKIGAHVVQIAHGFGMPTVGYDPFPNTDLESKRGFKYMTLNEVLKTADITTLHAPASKQNYHLLGSKEFEIMKRGSMLINTARGELVDTAALVETLSARHLGGAALDVIEGESLLDFDEETTLLQKPGDKEYRTLALEQSVLEKLPNVIISPHNAFNTYEALEKIRHTTCENIVQFLSNHPQNAIET